uniref:Mitochondrial inner membrane protease subunit 2 n=1 Tax=Rhizophora mucronata TaxID=61149 RepID=A0A2P2J7J5_RHIMU
MRTDIIIQAEEEILSVAIRLSTLPTLRGGHTIWVTLPLIKPKGIGPKDLESILKLGSSPSTQQCPCGILTTSCE